MITGGYVSHRQLRPENIPIDVVDYDPVVVFRDTHVLGNLLTDVLTRKAVHQVSAHGLFGGFKGVAPTQHDEVDIASCCRIEELQGLHTDNRRQVRVAIDGKQFQEFLAELDGRAVVNDGKELVLVLRPKIELIHLVNHLRREERDLGDLLRDVFVDRRIGGLAHQYANVLLEILFQDVDQQGGLA